MGTLASQTEIGVWVQASGAPLRIPPEKFWDYVYAKSYKLVHSGRKTVRNVVHNAILILKHFNNRNVVLIRSDSFSTTRYLRNDRCP